MAEGWRFALVDELVRQGVIPGMDFAVVGGDTGGGGSELMVLRGADDDLEVLYFDMGRESVLLRTADVSEARARFVDLVLDMAAGRGRGPRVPPDREPNIPLREHQARLQGEQP